MHHPSIDPALTFGDVLVAARRHWLALSATIGLAVAGALAYATLAPARFVAEAELLVEPQDGYYTQPGGGGWNHPYVSQEAVAGVVLLIRSQDLAREAVRRLGLSGHAGFDPDRAGEDALVERYLDNLTVSAETLTSRIVTVRFRAPDPDLAAAAANMSAALYLEQRGAARTGDARDAAAWLGPAVEDLRRRLARAEAEVEAHRAAAGLLAGTRGTTIAAQHLSDINGRLAALRRTEAEAAARARLIRELAASGRVMELSEVAGDPSLSRLAESRAALQARLAREGQGLGPGHPRLAALEARVADLDGAMRALAEAAGRAQESQARIAADRVEALREAIAAQERVVAGANGGEIRLRALEREARALREGLEAGLARLAEAGARQDPGSAAAEARIVSRAVPPGRPIFPRRNLIVALAAIAAAMLGFLVLVTRELLRAPQPVTR